MLLPSAFEMPLLLCVLMPDAGTCHIALTGVA
jgi:hypothetical protein